MTQVPGGDPAARRACIERTLANYPDLDSQAVADVRHWFRKEASALDVALLATNEDLAAAMCHGYAKIEGKPALTACHASVGTQHATMGIYDAFCDRAPMFVIIGNELDAARKRGVVSSPSTSGGRAVGTSAGSPWPWVLGAASWATARDTDRSRDSTSSRRMRKFTLPER